MINNYEVKIIENFGCFNVNIYIVEKNGSNISIGNVKNNKLEFTEIKGFEEQKPTLVLPLPLWEIFKHTIIDDKVRDKNEVEAELGATKYHLEDMRKLLKL